MTQPKLTHRQKREYIYGNGRECPFCRSHLIVEEVGGFDGVRLWRGMCCRDCKRKWRDVHILDTIEDVEENYDTTKDS